MLTATDTTWIRTESGAVQIEAGEGVPDDALPAEVERLTLAGLLHTKDAGEPTTVDEILAVVGDDANEAAAYLALEQASDRPRKSLIEKLTGLIEAEHKES
jgi:hypothetical protein